MSEFHDFGVLFLKALATLVAGSVAILAGLFFVASGLARGSSDKTEQRHALQTMAVALGALLVCGVILISLTGCAETRALYDACKDHLCR